MKRYFLLIFILLFIGVFIFNFNVIAEESLNLKEVVRLGLKNNTEIQNSELDYLNSENDYEIARRELYPEISLESSYTRREEGPMDFESNSETGFPVITEGPKDNYNTSLNISQPLYAGGRIRSGIDLAENRRELTGVQHQQQNNEIIYQIIQNYYQVLMAQDRVEIEKEALELVKEHKRLARSSLKAGTAIKSDVLQAEIEESQAEQRLLEAENQFKMTRKRLGNQVGLDSDFQLKTPEVVPEIGLDFNYLWQKAVNNRPEIELLDLNQEIARANLELEQKSHYPGIFLNGNYSAQGSEFEPEEGNWSITISGKITLYEGGKSGKEQDKIKNKLEQLQKEKNNLKNMVEMEIEQKIMEVEENENNIEIQNLNLRKAEENLELEEKRFQTGTGRSVDVLNAQNTFNQTRISRSQAQFTYEQSLYELLLKTGELSEYIKEVITVEN